MTVKLGILFLYRRIFRGPAFEATTLATVLLVAVWGISFFFSILFECTPINLSLKLPPGSPGIHCINQTANFWGLSISDVLMDLIILAIPFPFVWSLQMSLKHKFGVSGMFLLGVSLVFHDHDFKGTTYLSSHREPSQPVSLVSYALSALGNYSLKTTPT